MTLPADHQFRILHPAVARADSGARDVAHDQEFFAEFGRGNLVVIALADLVHFEDAARSLGVLGDHAVVGARALFTTSSTARTRSGRGSSSGGRSGSRVRWG